VAVQEIYFSYNWADASGSNPASFSGTVNLPHEMSFAVAQVALNRSAYFDTPGWGQIYLTGFTANGLFGSLPDGPPAYGVSNADSFAYEGDVTNGAITGLITVYCFE
jgi:hypothetical protein